MMSQESKTVFSFSRRGWTVRQPRLLRRGLSAAAGAARATAARGRGAQRAQQAGRDTVHEGQEV